MILLLAMVTQFSAVVITPYGTSSYSEKPDEMVDIDLPQPSKYACTRVPVKDEEQRAVVRFTCMDLVDNGSFSFGTSCATDKVDSSEARMVLDVSPTKTVVLVVFSARCRTTPGPGVVL